LRKMRGLDQPKMETLGQRSSEGRGWARTVKKKKNPTLGGDRHTFHQQVKKGLPMEKKRGSPQDGKKNQGKKEASKYG